MNTIDIDSLDELEIGDIVQHKGSGNSYVVVGNYGTFVTAVKEQNIMNPVEWVKVIKPSNDLPQYGGPKDVPLITIEQPHKQSYPVRFEGLDLSHPFKKES